MQLDAHDKPPIHLREIFKQYRKISVDELDTDDTIIDLSRAEQRAKRRSLNWGNTDEIRRAFHQFTLPCEPALTDPHATNVAASQHVTAYELGAMPGLFIIPGMLPLDVQKAVLARLFHHDLQNPEHMTNVHLHHLISYPPDGRSFFDCEPSHSGMVEPKDASMHKPMTLGQLMSKKLRWMTLGGQYDWTRKVYPDGEPPPFPADLSDLLRALFPQTVPEAAIVNLYSPGDTLSIHRDVSEQCDRGLISLSIGCDAIFVAGLGGNDDAQEARHVIARLKSGDALYMTGAARYAWHGVPMIIPNTCPGDLGDWPANASRTPAGIDTHEQWRGWMASKRINVNVRQMAA